MERFRYEDYWYVYLPDHPLSEKGGMVAEHLLIAERLLGRPLLRGGEYAFDEVVHHLDGDKSNNSPKNLLVCTRRYHTALHQAIRTFFEKAHFESLKNTVFTPDALTEYLKGFGCETFGTHYLGVFEL